MTIKRFERLLKQANPRLRLRVRGQGDIIGVFGSKAAGTGYITRMSKGELHLSGFRYRIVDPANKMRMINGNIQKRGRKTLITMLRDWRWITKHKDRSRILWGLKD